MSEFEVVLVLDPRLADEEVETLSNDFKELLGTYDAEVYREESWGKRRLAYPINKLKEGKYLIFQVRTGEQNPFVEVEQRLGQNEKVLRYLTVRTDEGRLRRRAPLEEPEEQVAEEVAS